MVRQVRRLNSQNKPIPASTFKVTSLESLFLTSSGSHDLMLGSQVRSLKVQGLTVDLDVVCIPTFSTASKPARASLASPIMLSWRFMCVSGCFPRVTPPRWVLRLSTFCVGQEVISLANHSKQLCICGLQTGFPYTRVPRSDCTRGSWERLGACVCVRVCVCVCVLCAHANSLSALDLC